MSKHHRPNNGNNPQHASRNSNPDRARQKAAILLSLSRGSTRARACEAARVPRRTFYNWMDQHASFRDQVEDAEQKPVAAAEAIALRCAMKAEEDPRYLRALFHFLKHRAGWGGPARREPEPPYVLSCDRGKPDPDEPLTAKLIEEMQAAQEAATPGHPRWGLAHVLTPEEPATPTTNSGESVPPVPSAAGSSMHIAHCTLNSVPSVPSTPVENTPAATPEADHRPLTADSRSRVPSTIPADRIPVPPNHYIPSSNHIRSVPPVPSPTLNAAPKIP